MGEKGKVGSCMLNGNAKYILDYLLHPFDIVRNVLFWRRAGMSAERVVFVVGAPRSGTTLMQRIVASHPGICSLAGETSVFSPKNVFNYERFSHILTRDEYDAALSGARSIVEFFSRIHEKVRNENCVVLLEKTPQHVKHLEYILGHFPHAKVINMLRDPRDAYCSGKRSGNIPQATSLQAYLAYWEKCVKGRQAVMGDKRVLDVRYESLVERPEREVNEVMAFLGLDFDRQQLHTTSIANDPRASEKAFSRLNQPITNETVGSWRNCLSTREKDYAVNHCGALMESMGYSVESM
jgi:hypothetical protein